MDKTVPVAAIAECPACQSRCADAGLALLTACASVGIEHGQSTGEMLTLYLLDYHRRGHRGRV